jgi:hypothetical protein
MGHTRPGNPGTYLYVRKEKDALEGSLQRANCTLPKVADSVICFAVAENIRAACESRDEDAAASRHMREGESL